MISLDTETTGLDPRKCKPTHMGYYNGTDFAMDTIESVDEATWKMLEHEREIIGHNFKFDAHMIWWNTGRWLPWKIDTMLLSQLYDSRVKHKLDTLGELYLGQGKFGDKKVLQAIKKGEFWMLSPETQTNYLKRDCELTYRLYEFFRNNISSTLWSLYETFDLPVSLALGRIETNGFTIDEELLNVYVQQLTDRLGPMALELRRQYGDINFNSPKQLLESLRTKYNISLQSTSERALQTIQRFVPEISSILEYRELNKYLTTYLGNIEKHLYKGKVYPQYHLAGDYHSSAGRGTTTGRTSSSNPNLQNQPRSSNGPVNIRSLFTAGSGNTLLAFDYSQLELKVGAFLSGERNLLEGDIHAEAARILKVERAVGKTCNFALLYGAGRNKIFYTAGGSKHVDKYIEWFEEKFPKVISWGIQEQKKCKEEGLVRTYLGRTRYLDTPESGPNSVIQGSAGDIGKSAALLLYGKGYRVNGLIHDEIILEVPERDIYAVAADVQRLMTKELPSHGEICDDINLEVTVKSGKNWGDMKELAHAKC